MPTLTLPTFTLPTGAPPSSIVFKQSVVFSAVDQNNNNAPINEGFIVSGPVSQGITPIFISGGAKAVIPLTTASGNGAPYLKIWFPNQIGNALYLTYCVANSAAPDGYYDYKTGVPTTYFSALRAWIAGGSSISSISTIIASRSLKFSAYGRTSNKPANATTFYIKFQGTFSTSSTSSS